MLFSKSSFEARAVLTLGWLTIFAIFALSVLLSGCAGAPRTAPRFVAASTQPIARATAVAKTHVEHARVILKEIQVESPQSRAQINAVSKDLDGALSELNTSEGARIQLQTQLEQQVTQANQMAADCDKKTVENLQLKESRHGWVKWFWYSAALNIAALAWIFRKPLMGLTSIGI